MRRSFAPDALDPVIAAEPVVVFLDSARPTEEQRHSFLFVKPRRIYRCASCAGIGSLLDKLSEESKKYWVAGYLTYEAAYGLEEKFSSTFAKSSRSSSDLAWFGIFDTPLRFDHLTGKWNRPVTKLFGNGGSPGRTGFTADQTAATDPAHNTVHRIIKGNYSQAIRRIRKFIAAGDVYQVNFTYGVDFYSSLQPWELYKNLRSRQPVPYGAFIKTPDRTIASFSPELFFMIRGRTIRTKPMKGTARRGRFTKEDSAIAAWLAQDAKNRSENIMIVDLLRNDLGKLCVPGSVKVTKLFAVERHPTVHQMTSTVQGRLRKGLSFVHALQSLFPCGSVTGAPKIRAMEIIGELEKRDRGVYCGAIGYSSPEGNAVFNVPIRTLQKSNSGNRWRYGVGSGIVWDSSAEDEWQECRDKCRFLTAPAPYFRLFETLLFTNGSIRFLREHRARIADSARYFDFPFCGSRWEKTILSIRTSHSSSGARFKVRIFLDNNGMFSWDHEPLPADDKNIKNMVRLDLSAPLDPMNRYLFHKTTLRPWYEKSMELIRNGRCFDVLHVNTSGQLTEGARSNIFVKIKGTLVTPPIECGLLPGVLRARLLASGKCHEAAIRPRDLKKAEKVYCGNSVRGLVEVAVV